jgi:glycyl-tRNA synthetase alpha chain
MLFARFDAAEQQCKALVEQKLTIPAYEQVLDASHTFNLLDARKAISVTERQVYILRLRSMSRAVAQAYYDSREALDFPMLPPSEIAAASK